MLPSPPRMYDCAAARARALRARRLPRPPGVGVGSPRARGLGCGPRHRFRDVEGVGVGFPRARVKSGRLRRFGGSGQAQLRHFTGGASARWGVWPAQPLSRRRPGGRADSARLRRGERSCRLRHLGCTAALRRGCERCAHGGRLHGSGRVRRLASCLRPRRRAPPPSCLRRRRGETGEVIAFSPPPARAYTPAFASMRMRMRDRLPRPPVSACGRIAYVASCSGQRRRGRAPVARMGP